MLGLSEFDLRLIRVFLAVADLHGFTAAQSELGMVTSTISNHVATLEQRLGTRLCQRGRGGFMLTPEGQTVYEAAKRLAKNLETFQGDVNSLRGELSGILRVGAIDTGVSDPLSPLLGAIRRYNQRKNSTRISLHVDDVTLIEKLILSGQLDVAVTCTPRKIEGINYTYLFDQWQMLYCSNQHPLFDRPDSQISNELLSKQRVVSRDVWVSLEAEKLLSRRPDALINHIDAKTHLILTGSYIGFMPAFHASRLVATGELRAVRPKDFTWATPYYSLVKKGTVPSRQLRAFLQDLRAGIKSRQ